MSIKPSRRHFQVVLWIGCSYVFRLSDCLVLNANGQTFSPNASAEFECIIDPYTFSQRWYVDSISVADCGAIVCSENASNPERYSFTPNTSAGNFTFKIDPILLEDNDKVIKCFDGTNIKETRIYVTETVTTATTSKTVNDNGDGGGGDDNGGGFPYWGWILVAIGIIVIIAIVCCCCCYCCSCCCFKGRRKLCNRHFHWGIGCTVAAQTISLDKATKQNRRDLREQQLADIKTTLRDWMELLNNCCIIMEGLLVSGEIFKKIMEEIEKVLSAMESGAKESLYYEMEKEERAKAEKLTAKLGWITKEHDKLMEEQNWIGHALDLKCQQVQKKKEQLTAIEAKINKQQTKKKNQGNRAQERKHDLQDEMDLVTEQQLRLLVVQKDLITSNLTSLENDVQKESLRLKEIKDQKGELEDKKAEINEEQELMKKQKKEREEIFLRGKELEVNENFERYIKQELVRNRAFSSFILKAKTFSGFIRRELEGNEDIYTQIKIDIESKKGDYTERMMRINHLLQAEYLQ